MSDTIKLSIVIPTKDRADMLNRVLESIERQPADQDIYEVIIIDNGSADHTKNIAREYQGRIKNCRYFYDDRPGLHVGRNRGLLESRGELIGYLDDDVTLFPNWINTVITAFEDEEVMYVGGSVIPYDMILITEDFRNKYAIRQGAYQFIYCISCFWEDGISENDTRIHETPKEGFFGGNSIYRKCVLYSCKGFHPDGMPKHLLMYRGDGEDYVRRYILEHNMKAMYYAQASVYHMIDVNRVSDAYINYMYYRNGISSMYTRLRESGLKSAMIRLLHIVFSIVRMRKIDSFMRGEIYLLLYYVFYKRVRKWVHKTSYF